MRRTVRGRGPERRSEPHEQPIIAHRGRRRDRRRRHRRAADAVARGCGRRLEVARPDRRAGVAPAAPRLRPPRHARRTGSASAAASPGRRCCLSRARGREVPRALRGRSGAGGLVGRRGAGLRRRRGCARRPAALRVGTVGGSARRLRVRARRRRRARRPTARPATRRGRGEEPGTGTSIARRGSTARRRRAPRSRRRGRACRARSATRTWRTARHARRKR